MITNPRYFGPDQDVTRADRFRDKLAHAGESEAIRYALELGGVRFDAGRFAFPDGSVARVREPR